MRSDLAGPAATRLAHRLDRTIWRMGIDRLLLFGGIGCCTAAGAATVAAGLDYWLRPGRLWLGGSVVWIVTIGVVVWSAWRLTGRQHGQRAGASWWPTRLAIARRWEQSLGGSPISAAVGFLDAAGQSAEHVPSVAADLAALAVKRADEAAAELDCENWPTAGLSMFLLGLVAGVSLFLSARSRPPDWQTALLRQLPPAVGGWPVTATSPPPLTQTSTPLTPTEIAAATRQLIARLTVCSRVAEKNSFDLLLMRVVDEVRQLAERLPAAAEASMIRRAATRLPTLASRATLVDRVAGLRQLAAAGQAAEGLAVASAAQQQLTDQLTRLLARQPGLLPEELLPVAQRQLSTLAATQQRLTDSMAAMVALLLDAGLDAALPKQLAVLPEQIGTNRLALATGGAAHAGRELAGTVVSLGLDIPQTVSLAGGVMPDSLIQPVVELTAVSRELDRELLDQTEAQGGAAGQGTGPLPPVAAGGRGPVALTGGAASAGLAEGEGGSANGQATSMPGTADGPFARVVAGPSWRLASPARPAVGRIAIDHTVSPATATAFGDYLERLWAPSIKQTFPSEQAGP